jgi:hypothetical protein
LNRKIIALLFGLGAVLATTAPAFADDPVGGGKAKGKMGGMPFQWKATSPAIHEGDRYNLVVTNTGDEAQEVFINTVIMDHRNHTNTAVVNERPELAPGEEREFAAVNDYGTANHFNTKIGSETRDLDLAVTVTDEAGTETARFNDGAFMVQEAGAGAKGKAKGKGEKAHGHSHDGGFVASVPAVLGDTARLAPMSLGVLALAGGGLFAARRRIAYPGAADRTAAPVSAPTAWRTTAVVGLALSAVLHFGLAPMHLGEAAIQGIFFYAAGVVAAVVAAAVLAWPSRPVYLAGAGISLALILLWAVFLLVPPPGAEVAEAVDLVGLFTKATELAAAAACFVLWLRARR